MSAHSEKLLKQLTGFCCEDRRMTGPDCYYSSPALVVLDVRKYEGGQLERFHAVQAHYNDRSSL